MATLTEKDRDKLRRSQFAYVDRKGGEHLPINDESHIRNAMARCAPEDRRRRAQARHRGREGLERRQARSLPTALVGTAACFATHSAARSRERPRPG